RRRHEATVARLRQHHPELEAYNPLDSPAECWPLLWSSFVCHTVFLEFGCDGYPDWLRVLAPDTLRRVYAYYRVQLQHLSWYEGGCHWVLKAPEHTPNLAFLLEQF